MQPKTVSLISEAEYLELERASEIKHEYYQGEIFAMDGYSGDFHFSCLAGLNLRIRGLFPVIYLII